MRRFWLGMVLSIMICLSVVGISKFETFAEVDTQTIDSSITIDKDTVFSNTDFVVDSACSRDLVFNVVAGTLTLDSCNVSSSTTEVFSCVINVGENANLVLKNTTFSNINYSQCIVNNGVIEIDNTTFVSNRTSIVNNGSNEKDSIKYYSGNLEKVTLNSGYISVFENTKVDNVVKVNITNFNDLTLAVKGVGENVFASKYISKFVYQDNPSTTDDKDYYFDYIGDFDTATTEIKDASGKVSLQPGDIVLTTMNLFLGDDEILYAPQYCTSYKYFKNEFERLEEDDDKSPIVLYGRNSRYMDNFTANMSSTNFSVKSSEGNFITLKVQCVTEGGVVVSSYQEVYLSGTNHAIFVDIPEGYEYNSVEFVKGVQNQDASNVLGILDGKLYANNCYIRPVIEYKLSTYDGHTITANFIVKEKITYANVSLTPSEGVSLNVLNNMVVDNEYTFTLNCDESKVISSIKFNGNNVDFNYDKDNNLYTFTAEVLENNTISVETKTILKITPKPNKVEFEYGDIVELKETYKVSETESIEIEYMASENTLRGTYSITEVKSCSGSDKYVIELVGNVTYSIIKKQVDLTLIQTKTHTVTYSENLTLDKSDFLVGTLPSYLRAELVEYTNFVEGEQFVRINFSVTNENYAITGDIFINAKLVVLPKEISTDEIVFEDTSVEYTGSKIEVVATNYDESLINVTYTYYLETDLDNSIQEIINVGNYVVKAEYSSKSSLHSVSGEKSISLIVTPKEIDMTSYLQAIEVTEFEYDGEEKSVDLKETSLPSGVVITNKNIVDTQINANIYYYDITFEPTSSNYSCVTSKRIALIINAKVVTLTLEISQFDYTGRAPNLVVVFDNVVDGDIVEPIFENAISSTIGTHTVRVLRLSNTNYALAGVVDLAYTISSVNVDMSGIRFDNVDTTYDGNNHLPELTGVLPLEITYELDRTEPCINAGMYTIRCTFTSSDSGILAPAPIVATVIIRKREVTAVYSEPSNMIANGQKKSLTAHLDGVVTGEDLEYIIEYSNEPILAGEYTCKVKLLDETNYTLKNNTPYRFIIFMSTINYSDKDINLSIDGKFSSRDNLSISKINDKLEVVNLLAKMEVKNYLALNLSCVSFTSELMTVSVDGKTIAENLNYLKAYRIKNNQLEEIEYTIKDNIISFKSNCNEKVIFVESHDYVYSHRVEIGAIIIFAIVSMLLIITIEIINVRNKKKARVAKLVK